MLPSKIIRFPLKIGKFQTKKYAFFPFGRDLEETEKWNMFPFFFILQGTGDILIPFPCKVKIVTGESMESAANVTFPLQRLLRSLSSPLLSWGSTQASPFTFTKEMIDFFLTRKVTSHFSHI